MRSGRNWPTHGARRSTLNVMGYATYGYGRDTDVIGSVHVQGLGILVLVPLVVPIRLPCLVSEEVRLAYVEEQLRRQGVVVQNRAIVIDDSGRRVVAGSEDRETLLDPSTRTAKASRENRVQSAGGEERASRVVPQIRRSATDGENRIQSAGGEARNQRAAVEDRTAVEEEQTRRKNVPPDTC